MTFPKLQIDINLLVLEDCGSVLSVAVLCASVAMATSGIEMRDLPVACTVVCKRTCTCIIIHVCTSAVYMYCGKCTHNYVVYFYMCMYMYDGMYMH